MAERLKTKTSLNQKAKLSPLWLQEFTLPACPWARHRILTRPRGAVLKRRLQFQGGGRWKEKSRYRGSAEYHKKPVSSSHQSSTPHLTTKHSGGKLSASPSFCLCGTLFSYCLPLSLSSCPIMDIATELLSGRLKVWFTVCPCLNVRVCVCVCVCVCVLDSR